MELVRVLALSFADDGKRVKVYSLSKLLFVKQCTCIIYQVTILSLCRFVFKGLWGRVHSQGCHCSLQELARSWSSWTGVNMVPWEPLSASVL